MTGTLCSALPHRSKTPPTGPQLSGADGRAIPCWGTVRRRLSFGLRTFFVTFLLAAVYDPSWFRLLVRPRAVGRPSRPPGAGLEDSETALQTIDCRRDTTLQVRRRPLLHSTVGTVPVGLGPGRPRPGQASTI